MQDYVPFMLPAVQWPQEEKNCSNKPASTINQLKHCQWPRAILASQLRLVQFFHIAAINPM